MIWLGFAAAILAVALILYMPGFFLLRAFGQSSINAFVFAPPLVLALYAIIEIVLSGLGIRGSWCTIFLPVLVIAVVVFLLPLLLKRKKKKELAIRYRICPIRVRIGECWLCMSLLARLLPQ